MHEWMSVLQGHKTLLTKTGLGESQICSQKMQEATEQLQGGDTEVGQQEAEEKADKDRRWETYQALNAA